MGMTTFATFQGLSALGPLPPEDRLRLAFDALIDALWLFDPVRDERGRITDFRVADLNTRAADMARMALDDARGRLLSDLDGAIRRLAHVERYAEVVETGVPCELELSPETPGHPPVWLWVHGARAGRGLALTVRDVTDRVARERARSESESEFRLLAENATDMIARVAPDGRISYMSRASRDILGFEPAEMIGRDLGEFVHPDDRRAFLADRRLLERGRSLRNTVYRGIRKGGGSVWLESTTRVVTDPSGATVEYQAATRDIGERAMAEAEHAALHRVSEAVAGGVDDAALYALVAAEMARLIDADGARVVRYIDDGEAEVLGAWRRAGLVPVPPGERIALSPTWAISQVRTGGTTAVAHLSRDDAARAGAGLRMGIAAPVRADGGLWGAVAAAFRDSASVPPGATQRVERFAKLVGLAVANAEARARLIEQATTDALTGLVNHTTFHSALAGAVARAERHDLPLSLGLIDLDRFKALNDTMGHRAGDAALAIVGGLLRRHARRGDVVGRIGGEELAWLMPDTDGPGGVEAAERLRRAVAAAPIAVPAGLTASFGVAARSAADRGPEGLFHRADQALYQAKRVGRDRVVGPA